MLTPGARFSASPLGSGKLSPRGHLGCGSYCDRSKGKGTRRSPDLMLLGPLSPPVDFVSPLPNLEGPGRRRIPPQALFPGFSDTGKGRRGEHGPPEAVPLPAEVAGEPSWALPLCLPLLPLQPSPLTLPFSVMCPHLLLIRLHPLLILSTPSVLPVPDPLPASGLLSWG